MRFHLYNQNRLPGDERGSVFLQGKWVLSIGELLTISFCWNLKSTFCHAYVEVGGVSNDDDLGFALAFPPAAFWLHFSGKLTRWIGRLPGDYDGRKLSVGIHGGAFWASIWARQNSWSRDDPWWMHWHLDFLDVLLGDRKHEVVRVLESRDVRVPMPEGVYDAKAELKLESWKRPRWPWPLLVTRLHMDIAKGVPIPGKGENSWDCGPDATGSITMPARTIEEGIGGFVGSTLLLRRRRGGRDDYAERPQAA